MLPSCAAQGAGVQAELRGLASRRHSAGCRLPAHVQADLPAHSNTSAMWGIGSRCALLLCAAAAPKRARPRGSASSPSLAALPGLLISFTLNASNQSEIQIETAIWRWRGGRNQTQDACKGACAPSRLGRSCQPRYGWLPNQSINQAAVSSSSVDELSEQVHFLLQRRVVHRGHLSLKVRQEHCTSSTGGRADQSACWGLGVAQCVA